MGRTGDDRGSAPTRRTGRDKAYQEKMRLGGADPRRPAQAAPTAALALAPGTEISTSLVVGGSGDSTDKKMAATVTDQHKLIPGAAITGSQETRSDWDSSVDVESTAGTKSDLDEAQVAQRAFAENRKMQRQPLLMATPATGMPQEDEGTPTRTFEGENLSLAPPRAPASNNNAIPSAHEAAARQRPGPHEKYRLRIDPRAAPLEHNTNTEGIAFLEATETSVTGREAIVSDTTASLSTDSRLPASHRLRTPAQGYTVNARNKGPRNHDAIAPGAIAVTDRQRRDTNNDDLDVRDSMFVYSATVDGRNLSAGGDALSTGAVQGSVGQSQGMENSHAAWTTSPQGQFLSQIPPEMGELDRNQPSSISVETVSSSTEDIKNNKKDGIATRMIWIIIGILVVVIALATGLALGLGGNDKSSTNGGVETEAPTVTVNVTIFQSLVEDFYDDGGRSVFKVTNSPQYQALLWLAGDPNNESLDVDKIRILYALAVFYYNTNSDNFISYPTWSQRYGFLNSTTDDICKWNNGDSGSPQGVWCDATGTKVETLSFPSNNLVGAIPAEIGMLTDLQNLVLGSNKLKSTFPESLFKLTALKVVDLNANSISGTLPSTFAEATSLEILNLGSNALRGPISLDHLVRSIFCPLKKVILTRNTFSGTFPMTSIAANCTATTSINLDSSGLVIEGGIPPTGLERLTILDLTKTELSGSIPDEISRFKFLQHFRIDNNALNGTIPETLGELTKLTWLSLATNSLERLIPTTLGQLQQLTTLDLQANSFSGSIPSELAGCTSLVNVNFEMNSLTGDIDYLCPLSLEELVSDCGGGNVVCSCCTQCY